VLVTLITGYQRDKNDKHEKFPSLLPPVKKLTSGDEKLLVDHCQLRFEHSDQINSQALSALKRSFFALAFKDNCGSLQALAESNAINTIHVEIKDGSGQPLSKSLQYTDESYNLQITSEGIHVIAPEYSGVARALATLVQLVRKAPENFGYYHITHLPIEINDNPRYSFRGLMVDTSRRFYSTEILKEVIEYMALAKFNVFHWHIVDDDSFPMELQSRPTITENGAFSENEVYTKDDIEDIVAFASSWGVRVIPEFDNPGHTRSLGMDPGLQYLTRCFNRDWPYTVSGAYKIKGGPPTGVIDPSYAESYDVVEGILRDMNDYFPDTMVHLGGDEVLSSCFNENPSIQDFMIYAGVSTYDDLVTYFIGQIRDRLTSINPNKQAIYWSNEDTFDLRYKA